MMRGFARTVFFMLALLTASVAAAPSLTEEQKSAIKNALAKTKDKESLVARLKLGLAKLERHQRKMQATLLAKRDAGSAVASAVHLTEAQKKTIKDALAKTKDKSALIARLKRGLAKLKRKQSKA